MKDENLELLVETSGAMWTYSANREFSPVLLRTPQSGDGMIYELTLPKGEGHPYWRVRERAMTWDEREGYAKALALGTLHPMGFAFDEKYLVRGHVFNGRRRVWADSVPTVV